MKHLIICLSLLSALPLGIAAEERGFIHPGGLHTQEDFDRVREQIRAKNPAVVQAWNKLRGAEYAQPGVQTSPVATIVRGGGSGENYINAARGAAMAYQNALRWKIAGTRTNATAAVRILMAWAKTTTAISGNSDQCLAVGLYGYQFAQAAELMRDFDGWKSEDFETFRQWMLELWYPKAIGFLRQRNGTWQNSGRWWQAPGHYWSNWGLCNVLCVMSIGILCDDVQIYNEALSFIKYDQVGNYTGTPTLHDITGHDGITGKAIWNDGLTEFWGNLIVTTSSTADATLTDKSGNAVEAGAYGEMGQMNESGRDTGHSAMALGLAIDIAKVAYNQGDDLFAYMNHRLAAGIEYVAAQTQSIQGLPWTNYHYATSGLYYSDGRTQVMTAPALGAQMRPYWATVIGIYEGVKGVRMPFAEMAYTDMGIDGGGAGATSGGYDHLGYSVLMNTREPQLCPAELTPTELTGEIEFSISLTASLIPSLEKEKQRGLVSGKTTRHTELGALVNTYSTTKSTPLPDGRTLRLVPILPEGEEDTGRWQWNTGQTTREITVSTGWSYIYRVTYTNSRGVESRLAFSIATTDKGTPVGIGATPMTDAGTTRDGSMEDDACYDLGGRRVASRQAKGNLARGIYIAGKRKVLKQ